MKLYKELLKHGWTMGEIDRIDICRYIRTVSYEPIEYVYLSQVL